MGPCQFTRQWWLKPHQKYQNISRLTSFVAWIPCIVISCFLGRLNIHSLLDIASCKLHSSVMHVPIKIWPPSYTAAVWWQGARGTISNVRMRRYQSLAQHSAAPWAELLGFNMFQQFRNEVVEAMEQLESPQDFDVLRLDSWRKKPGTSSLCTGWLRTDFPAHGFWQSPR